MEGIQEFQCALLRYTKESSWRWAVTSQTGHYAGVQMRLRWRLWDHELGQASSENHPQTSGWYHHQQESRWVGSADKTMIPDYTERRQTTNQQAAEFSRQFHQGEQWPVDVGRFHCYWGVWSECIPSKFICWHRNPQDDGIQRQGLWEMISSWGRSPHEWD